MPLAHGFGARRRRRGACPVRFLAMSHLEHLHHGKNASAFALACQVGMRRLSQREQRGILAGVGLGRAGEGFP